MVQLADGAWYGVSANNGAALAGKTHDEAVQALAAENGGLRKVATGQDLLDNQDLWAKQIWARSADGALVKGFAFQYMQDPMSIYANSPAVGEHTETILRDI